MMWKAARGSLKLKRPQTVQLTELCHVCLDQKDVGRIPLLLKGEIYRQARFFCTSAAGAHRSVCNGYL